MDLPPPFRVIKLREVGDAFVHAQSIAASEVAGTLVYVGRFNVVEFAAVFEPDEPLRLARRAFYAGLNALGDALTANAPPGLPVTFSWPDAIHVDGLLRHSAKEVAASNDDADFASESVNPRDLIGNLVDENGIVARQAIECAAAGCTRSACKPADRQYPKRLWWSCRDDGSISVLR